jgi:nanoRNase/pAp phosphatase (c-di-AMP/oligoRNAs hydrolase)
MPGLLVLSIALPVLVVGHKGPDTDSMISALAMADLLRRQGLRAESIAQGDPNPETAFVLQRCGLQAPLVRRSVGEHPVVLVIPWRSVPPCCGLTPPPWRNAVIWS